MVKNGLLGKRRKTVHPNEPSHNGSPTPIAINKRAIAYMRHRFGHRLVAVCTRSTSSGEEKVRRRQLVVAFAMFGLRHAIHSQFTGLVDAVTPASSVSRFESERVCRCLPSSLLNLCGRVLAASVGSGMSPSEAMAIFFDMRVLAAVS